MIWKPNVGDLVRTNQLTWGNERTGPEGMIAHWLPKGEPGTLVSWNVRGSDCWVHFYRAGANVLMRIDHLERIPEGDYT